VTHWKRPRFGALGVDADGPEGTDAGAGEPMSRWERLCAFVRQRRRWFVGAGAGVAVAVLGLFLGVRPWIEARVREEAAQRGFALEVARVSPGWFQAKLHGVSVRPLEVPSITVHLEEVAVGLGADLRPSELAVAGGRIEIEGRLEQVTEQLESWRARWRGESKGAGGGGGGLEYRASGVSLAWRGAFADGDEQRLTGLQFERTTERQQLGVDQLAAKHPRGALELAGLRALWERGDGPDRLAEASVAEARLTARLPADEGNSGSNSGATDTVDGDDAAQRTATTRATGPAQAAPVEEGGLARRLPPVDPDRGPRWKRLLGHWISLVGARLPEQSKVGALWLEVERGDQRLHLGPSTFSVERRPEALALALTPQGETRGTPLAVEATLPLGADGPVHLKLEGGPVSLATLGVREGDFGLVGVGQAEVGGLVEAKLAPDGAALDLRADAQLERLTVRSEQLAPRPVSIQRTRLLGRASVGVDGSRYAIERAELQVGEASFKLQGNIERGEDFVALAMSGGTPLIACQTLLDSAPRGLLDRVEQVKMQGTLSLDVGVNFDTRKPADMKVRWDLKNACRITEVPATLSPQRFAMPWAHEVLGPGNTPIVHETGPGTPNWTPSELLSPHLESAVLVCEDGRFFRHDGFDPRAIEASIQLNVRAGHFVRGASTISMQLAKNLYLTREKQLSRKLQEAVLTMLLEQELTKQQLLELYFNIVELGPGIYGIAQAARHYFATTPDQLTLSQAFFLVSILPSPTRQFFDAEGRLNPGRAAYVRQLLKIAHERKRITDSELEVGLSEELRFGSSSTLPEHDDGSPLFPAPDIQLDGAGPATRTGPPVIRAPSAGSRASATGGVVAPPPLPPP
jgi:hypothetical protein